ncbi:MAG: HD domain-containing phosphohydrolase [Candidatus Omnitrophota bacterium]|nr:HD domain-containing protein [Candidatus Omnitrophota bacterium]
MERILSKFNENWNLKQESSALNKYLKNPVWIIIPILPVRSGELKHMEIAKYISKNVKTESEFRNKLKKIHKVFKKSRRKKTLEQFEYGEKIFSASYPLVYDGHIFGMLLVCELKKEISLEFQHVFTSFVDTIIRESRKEIELEELNKTVRPRAIALSTVHTVHRLMTSTLDLNELLPRVARLSLQVIRANRCSIKLVDKKRKVLLPRTTIDLRKEKTKLKKVQIGKYAPGRAVKQGRPIRGRNYLAYPMIDEDVVGVITLYDKLDGTKFSEFDEDIMKTLSEQAAIAIKNAQLFKEQTDLTLSSIKCIAQLLQNRPHGAHRAEASFLKLISIIGLKFNMNESETKMLQYAAMLHDAGQISIPEKVLMKKSGLTGQEYDIVKTHSMKGASILSKFKPLKPLVPIILYHHENYDGTGYPRGLKGKEIPLSARILAIVSAFEAMITEKPYRKALSVNIAIKEVVRNSGTQFDPDVVDIFCYAVRRKDIERLLKREIGGHYEG